MNPDQAKKMSYPELTELIMEIEGKLQKAKQFLIDERGVDPKEIENITKISGDLGILEAEIRNRTLSGDRKLR